MSKDTAVNLHRRKILSAAIAAFFVMLTIMACTVPVHAERDTVRIGFFSSEKYGYIGADGELTGYDIHLSKTIAMYGGFKAEMVQYDNVSEMEEALRNNDVDILIDFLRTEKREKEFIFSNNPVLDEQVSLFTLNAPEAPSADSITRLKKIRVGYATDSGFLDSFKDYCRESGIKPELIPLHDEAEMISAMERGETDACLTGSMVPAGYRVLLSTPPIYSYMMFRADDTDLRIRVDAAISQLKTDDPDYISDLYNTYVVSREMEMSPLNKQEREYLAKHHDLSVALVRGAEPFTIEQTDGSLGGIIPDYYRALGKRLGVRFSFVAYDRTRDAIDAVTGGEADILGHYYGNIILAEREDLYDTMEYGSTECARLTRSGFTGKVRTAAATTRTTYLLAEQLDPDIRLESYSNLESCYEALMNGEVDAMIGSMTGISWLINQHTMREVNLSILPNITLGIRGAVSVENSTLMFALNKAIAVSDDAMNEAILANAVDGSTDLHTAIEHLPRGFIIAVVGVLLTLVILLIITLVRLALNNRERVAILSREMNMDSLTGAGSRRFGTEILNRELLLYRRHGDGPLIAMFDVDHFKGKNDRYGHEYGDFVLKKVVSVLKGTLRQSDVIIRWGGDEFIILCSRVQADAADNIMEKVINAVGSADFIMGGKGEQITISAGVSFFMDEDEDINAVLRRCDSALYKAKDVRNTYRIFDDQNDQYALPAEADQ